METTCSSLISYGMLRNFQLEYHDEGLDMVEYKAQHAMWPGYGRGVRQNMEGNLWW